MFCRLLETMLLLTISKGLLLCRCQAFEKMDDTMFDQNSFILFINWLWWSFRNCVHACRCCVQVQEANFDFWWMPIHESCVGNMMNNFTSPYTLRPTFTQMALQPFVIVFKWLYCPSRDLISCQNISAS